MGSISAINTPCLCHLSFKDFMETLGERYKTFLPINTFLSQKRSFDRDIDNQCTIIIQKCVRIICEEEDKLIKEFLEADHPDDINESVKECKYAFMMCLYNNCRLADTTQILFYKKLEYVKGITEMSYGTLMGYNLFRDADVKYKVCDIIWASSINKYLDKVDQFYTKTERDHYCRSNIYTLFLAIFDAKDNKNIGKTIFAGKDHVCVTDTGPYSDSRSEPESDSDSDTDTDLDSI